MITTKITTTLECDKCGARSSYDGFWHEVQFCALFDGWVWVKKDPGEVANIRYLTHYCNDCIRLSHVKREVWPEAA